MDFKKKSLANVEQQAFREDINVDTDIEQLGLEEFGRWQFLLSFPSINQHNRFEIK